MRLKLPNLAYWKMNRTTKRLQSLTLNQHQYPFTDLKFATEVIYSITLRPLTTVLIGEYTPKSAHTNWKVIFLSENFVSHYIHSGIPTFAWFLKDILLNHSAWMSSHGFNVNMLLNSRELGTTVYCIPLVKLAVAATCFCSATVSYCQPQATRYRSQQYSKKLISS